MPAQNTQVTNNTVEVSAGKKKRKQRSDKGTKRGPRTAKDVTE